MNTFRSYNYINTKHIKHIIERHRYNVVHPNDGLCPQRNFPVLLLQSRKMKGYTLQQNRFTSSSRSHSLYSSTIQYHIELIYNALFYRGNTMGKFLGFTQYHGSAILLANTHPPKKNLGGSAPEPPFSGHWPKSQGRGNECTVLLGYNHNWIISLDLED